MGRLYKEQAVIEQITLSDFNKWMDFHSIKVAVSGLRQFLKPESPLKRMKNTFQLKYSSRSHDI